MVKQPPTKPLDKRLRLFRSRAHTFLYRLTAGRFPKVENILILTTTGRKTGRKRSTPLIFIEDNGRYAVISSIGGNDLDPGWLLNLKASPIGIIEIREMRITVRASIAEKVDRDRLWKKFVEIHPNYANYASLTNRTMSINFLEQTQMRS